MYAVDVNVDQLDWKLQKNPLVVPLKKNARDLKPGDLPEAVNLVVADVSFISVTKVLPAAVQLVSAGCDFLILIKPQFELQREDVGPGGIVSQPGLHEKAIDAVRSATSNLSLQVAGVRASKLPGAEGNQEYFLHARKSD